MKFSKNTKIFLAMYIFLALGTVITGLTHYLDYDEKNGSGVQVEPKLLSGLPFDSQDHQVYIGEIKPIIASINNNSSAADIIAVKERIFNFKSNDSGIGKVHVHLYLAFVDFENYLSTENRADIDQAVTKLDLVADYLPELQDDIDNLTNIFEQWVNT